MLEDILPGTPFSFLAPYVKPARKVLGFDSRRVSPDSGGGRGGGVGSGGGTVVQTMNAPVSFARNQITTGVRSTQSGPDSQIMWVCDNVGDVGLNTTDGVPVYGYSGWPINPLDADLFPNFYTQFEDWERWRPIKCIAHYAHFAPTDLQGSVCLAVNEDPISDEVDDVASTFSKLSTLSHSVVGSVYEDLSLDCTPASWKDGTWLYNDATTEAGNDIRFQYPGYVIFGADNGNPAQVTADTPTGILFFELAFEVCGRRTPYDGVGITYRAIRLAKQLKTQEERDAFLAAAAVKWLESTRKTVKITRPADGADERKRFLSGETGVRTVLPVPKSRPVTDLTQRMKALTFEEPASSAPVAKGLLSAQVMQSNLLRK